MRRVLLAGLFGLLVAPGVALAGGCSVPTGADAIRAEVADLVNSQRGSNRRAKLSRTSRLDRAAQDHACWMARTGKYGHTGVGGSTPKVRVKAAGYRSCLTAENIAWGQKSAGEVVRDWMNSDGHRRNILNGKLSDIGLGLATLNGRSVWVLVFARPC